MVTPTLPLPHCKFDCKSALATLNSLPNSQWQDHIPLLLTWLQDHHWPIFDPVQELLLKNPDGCIGPLIDVYDGRDTEWQYNTLFYLVPEMPRRCRYQLLPALRRLRLRPTQEPDFVDEKSEIDVRIDDLIRESENDESRQ